MSWNDIYNAIKNNVNEFFSLYDFEGYIEDSGEFPTFTDVMGAMNQFVFAPSGFGWMPEHHATPLYAAKCVELKAKYPNEVQAATNDFLNYLYG